MSKKLCHCKTESAFYYAHGCYYCQHCDGLLINFERVKIIIDFNIPKHIINREEIIQNNLDKHIKCIE